MLLLSYCILPYVSVSISKCIIMYLWSLCFLSLYFLLKKKFYNINSSQVSLDSTILLYFSLPEFFYFYFFIIPYRIIRMRELEWAWYFLYLSTNKALLVFCRTYRIYKDLTYFLLSCRWDLFYKSGAIGQFFSQPSLLWLSKLLGQGEFLRLGHLSILVL